jgi:rare lipoprotein A
MRTRDLLTRFAVGCVVAMLMTACATPLEPTSQAPGKTPVRKPSSSAAAPVGAGFDLHWPGRVRRGEGLSPSDNEEPEDGQARLRADAGTFFQAGTASWYGKKFHGRRTATGETFDMNEPTAAHLTLPLGSYALIRNVSNDKSVVVKINDRGPFSKGRIIDVSYGAAKQLGFIKQGKAKVEVRRLSRSEVSALGLDQPVSVRVENTK